MNYGKAVEEVWEWREIVAKDIQAIPREKRVNYINKTTQNSCKRLGIKYRKPIHRTRQHS